MPKSSASSTVTIYGSPGSRSPLVNWACLELSVPFAMGDLDNNPHPFAQLPCLTDGDNDAVIIFESGAIVQYLQQTYGPTTTSPADAAAILSWIVWANASFDPICFLNTPAGKVYDTAMRQPNQKVKRLDDLLAQNEWIIGETFTVADVAIASYGLYVLLFFPDVSLAKHWPNLTRYLLKAAQRPHYGTAFGPSMQKQLVNKLQADLKQYVK
jgi:glutathione S-transferase